MEGGERVNSAKLMLGTWASLLVVAAAFTQIELCLLRAGWRNSGGKLFRPPPERERLTRARRRAGRPTMAVQISIPPLVFENKKL